VSQFYQQGLAPISHPEGLGTVPARVMTFEHDKQQEKGQELVSLEAEAMLSGQNLLDQWAVLEELGESIELDDLLTEDEVRDYWLAEYQILAESGMIVDDFLPTLAPITAAGQ